MHKLNGQVLKNTQSDNNRVEWRFQISTALRSVIWFCAFFLISVGMSDASEQGQIVLKEQRGMIRPAKIGVVVWKDQPFHSDAIAKVFAYDRMKYADPVTWFYSGLNAIRFEPHQYFQHMSFPQWPMGEIVTQEDYESLKLKLNELEEFVEKYPNAKVHLDGMIGSMREAVKKFSSGKVFFSGNWINQEEHQKIASKRNKTLIRYAEERRELEKKLSQEAKLAWREKQDASARLASKWILGFGGAWLLLMFLTLLTRNWGSTWILVGALAIVVGWFTYAESGLGWTKYVLQAVNDAPSILMTLKDSLMFE